MNKPDHVTARVWNQHLVWMQVMREGKLTGPDDNMRSAPDQGAAAADKAASPNAVSTK